MDNEKIEVDLDGLAAQVRDSSEKGGFSIKVWVPPFTDEDNRIGGSILPLVDFTGVATPFVLAVAIKTLENAISQLKEYDDVDEALEFIEQNTRCGGIVHINGNEEEEDD